MKIKLSNYYWLNLYGMIGLGIIAEIGMLYFFIDFSGKDLIICLSCMLFYILIFGFVAFLPWKYLMTMEIKENVMRSYLFGKLKCEVHTDQKIYYAIFKCRESNSNIKKYIAISNEWFICEERKRTLWSQNTFIDYYDRTKQIVFPYDEKTMHLFTTEKWICVN